MSDRPIRLMFVCLGNICRSPTAEAVMRDKLRGAGLGRDVEVDSAGTGAWHVGEPPDDRARAEARRRGIPLDHTARQFTAADFDRFDLVLAMDEDNVRDLERVAATPEHRSRIRLLRDFDPAAGPGAAVPDPYYGEGDGFARVFDLLEVACTALLDDLVEHHRLEPRR